MNVLCVVFFFAAIGIVRISAMCGQRSSFLELTALLGGLLFATSPAYAITYSGQRVTKVDPTQSSTCIDPPGAQSFVTTDNTVYLYFYATVASSDGLTNDWVGPDGTTIAGGSWGSGSSGSFCFTGPSLTITNTPANRLGPWTARVWNNGVVLFAVPFTISALATGGGTPAGPTATTSRRTLPVDLTSSCYYAPTNRFDQKDGWQCTRFAWGRACEKSGVAIHFTNESSGGLDGGTWYGRVTGLALGANPRPNSIAVWSDGGAGHVAFVEEVNNGSVTISEANFTSYPNAQYDGLRTLSTTAMAQRGSLHLLGYIYLTGYEGYIDSASNSCSSAVSGWVADRSNLNASQNLELFDGETFLGSVYANLWRQDVGSYLNDNGNHGFSYPIPDRIKDGQAHTIWARVAGTYTDLANTQSISCTSNANSTAGSVQLTFSPINATPVSTADCATYYTFTLTGKETSGTGVNLSSLSLSEGWTWTLPYLGIPGRIEPFGQFTTNVNWCRGTGASKWTIIGTDDKGNRSSWASTITFGSQ